MSNHRNNFDDVVMMSKQNLKLMTPKIGLSLVNLYSCQVSLLLNIILILSKLRGGAGGLTSSKLFSGYSWLLSAMKPIFKQLMVKLTKNVFFNKFLQKQSI